MALDFAKSPGGNDTYPKRSFDGQEDQSYGFNPAYKLQTGTLRGTQTIANTDGSKITLGIIPGTNNEFGIAKFDPQGNLISKDIGSTRFVYDLDTNKNIIQDGELPDGTYGFVVAKEGFDVSEVFSG